MLSQLRQRWHRFRADAPGERFLHYHERLRAGDGKGRVARIGAGVALIVAGVVMLVIPGPGILAIFFGLALCSGDSRKLAQWLDRLELRARAVAGWARRRWRGLPLAAKVALITVGLAGSAAAAWLMWRWFTS